MGRGDIRLIKVLTWEISIHRVKRDSDLGKRGINSLPNILIKLLMGQLSENALKASSDIKRCLYI